MTGFTDPLTDDQGTLLRDQVQSTNYDASTGAGWNVNKDGTASFGAVYVDELTIARNYLTSPATPVFHLAAFQRLMAEVCTPKMYTLGSQYDTTTTDADPGFGTLALPSNSNFLPGNGSVNFLITANLDVFTGGLSPTSQVIFTMRQNGTGLNPDMRMQLPSPSMRGAFSKSWLVVVGYSLGVPQSSFDCVIKQDAGGNPHHISGGSEISIVGYPKPDSFCF